MKVKIDSVGFSPDFRTCIVSVDARSAGYLPPRWSGCTGTMTLVAEIPMRDEKMPSRRRIEAAVRRVVAEYQAELEEQRRRDAMLHEAGGYAGMEVEVE